LGLRPEHQAWRVIWVLVSAGFFVASFPPFLEKGGGLALLAVVILLEALRGASLRWASRLGFLWGMVAYGLSLPWFWNIFHAPAIALWAILAMFVVGFAWMQCLAEKLGIGGWRWVVFTMVNWSGWEFIRAELFPLKFPWMTPGVAMGPNVLLPWIGVYGVSGLMVLWAAVVASRPSRLKAAAWLMIGAVLFPLVLASSQVSVDPSRAIRVAAVQDENVSVNVYQKHTEALPGGVDLVVWPEYSLPYDLRANKTDLRLIQAICQRRDVLLVLGTETVPKGGQGYFNTALTLDGNQVWGEHYKVHPVHLFNDGTPGKTALPVKTPLGLVGTPICFDCDYEAVVRRMTAAGAEFFAVPTMDAESWTARQHVQHAILARIRACENARWMVVAASSGVSQIIDPHGQVHRSAPPLVSQTLVGEVTRETQLTFYTRHGWLTPWILLSAAVICGVALLIGAWQTKRRPPSV